MRRNQLLYHDPVTARLWLAIWGMIIAFPERERMHALSYAQHDDFDRGIQELVCSRLSAGQVFIDVGASVGVLTTIGARMVGAGGLVIAVEPLAHLCETITGNVVRNAAATPLVVMRNVAMDRVATLEFDVFDEDSRIATVFPYDDAAFPVAPRSRVNVDALRVDAMCPPDRAVHLVKIDAEGAELFVLRGLEGVLSRSPRLEIILEWGPSHFARAGYDGGEIIAWAHAHGFSLQAIHGVTGALQPFDRDASAANVLLSRRQQAS